MDTLINIIYGADYTMVLVKLLLPISDNIEEKKQSNTNNSKKDIVLLTCKKPFL